MKILQDATLSSVCVYAFLVAGHFFLQKKKMQNRFTCKPSLPRLIAILAAISGFLVTH
jgi:hypothetical protein